MSLIDWHHLPAQLLAGLLIYWIACYIVEEIRQQRRADRSIQRRRNPNA